MRTTRLPGVHAPESISNICRHVMQLVLENGAHYVRNTGLVDIFSLQIERNSKKNTINEFWALLVMGVPNTCGGIG